MSPPIPTVIAKGWDEERAREHLGNLDREIHAIESRADWLEAQARNARAEAEIRRGQRQESAEMFSAPPIPRSRILGPNGVQP